MVEGDEGSGFIVIWWVGLDIELDAGTGFGIEVERLNEVAEGGESSIMMMTGCIGIVVAALEASGDAPEAFPPTAGRLAGSLPALVVV